MLYWKTFGSVARDTDRSGRAAVSDSLPEGARPVGPWKVAGALMQVGA